MKIGILPNKKVDGSEKYFVGKPETNVKTVYENQLTISTARSVKEVEDIKDSWEAMQPSPLAEIGYYLAVVNSRQEVERPHVILLSREGRPETMLVGRIEYLKLKYNIGGKVIFSPTVRSLTIILGGILGNISSANSAILISELIKSLKRYEADIVFFSEIPTDSHIYNFSKTIPKFFSRDHFPHIDSHYMMTLPASIDNVLKRKNRKRIRSQWRKLKRDYSEDVQVKIVDKKSQIEWFCLDAEEVSKKTYQYAYGEGFVCSAENRYLLSSLAKQGLLRAYILYVENSPCAFWAGYIYKDTFYGIPVGGTGYDPKYRRYGVGILLMWQMIEELCLDTRVRYLDFGLMDTSYKRGLCDMNWEEASYYIFQPTLKRISLNALRVVFSLSHRFGNMILSHLKLKDKWEKFKRASVATK